MIGKAFVALAVLSAKVYAQDLEGLVSGLSSGCQVAASSLLSSPLTGCANVLGLVSVVSATGSVVQPVNSWISGICSSDPCSQTDLTSANQAITSGCATDIQGGNEAAQALALLTSNYTQLREVTCLQATSNNTFCLTNFLQGVQDSTGKDITKDFVINLFQTPDAVINTLSEVPASTLCTDCDKAIINSVTGLISADQATTLKSAASDKCGASFVDGTTPSTVSAATANSAAMNVKVPVTATISLALVAVGAILLA